MKKTIVSSFAILCAMSANCNLSDCPSCSDCPSKQIELKNDITNQMPEISIHENFEKKDNVAQYKNADWSNVVGIARGISREKACFT